MKWPAATRHGHRRTPSAEEPDGGQAETSPVGIQGAAGSAPRPGPANTAQPTPQTTPNASQPIGPYALPPRVYANQPYSNPQFQPPLVYHPHPAGSPWPASAAPVMGAYPGMGAVRAGAYDSAQAHEEYMMSLAIAASANDYRQQQQRVAERQQQQQQQQQQQEAQTRQRQGNDRAKKAAEARSKAVEAAAALSLKYWQTGCLDYTDHIVDGLFEVFGDFPEIEELVGADKFPSIEALKRVQTAEGDQREVVLIDHDQDNNLCALEERAAEATAAVAQKGTTARVQALARVVVERMGGTYDSNDTLAHFWLAASDNEKKLRKSAVILLGNLPVGAIRHRALMFKLLADSLDIKCQIRKGVSSEGFDDVAYSMVQIDGKEFVVDLLSSPGQLLPPASFTAQHNLFKKSKSGRREKVAIPVLPPPPGPSPLGMPPIAQTSRATSSADRSGVHMNGHATATAGAGPSSSGGPDAAESAASAGAATAQQQQLKDNNQTPFAAQGLPALDESGTGTPAWDQQTAAHHHLAASFDELAAQRVSGLQDGGSVSSTRSHIPVSRSFKTRSASNLAVSGTSSCTVPDLIRLDSGPMPDMHPSTQASLPTLCETGGFVAVARRPDSDPAAAAPAGWVVFGGAGGSGSVAQAAAVLDAAAVGVASGRTRTDQAVPSGSQAGGPIPEDTPLSAPGSGNYAPAMAGAGPGWPTGGGVGMSAFASPAAMAPVTEAQHQLESSPAVTPMAGTPGTQSASSQERVSPVAAQLRHVVLEPPGYTHHAASAGATVYANGATASSMGAVTVLAGPLHLGSLPLPSTQQHTGQQHAGQQQQAGHHQRSSFSSQSSGGTASPLAPQYAQHLQAVQAPQQQTAGHAQQQSISPQYTALGKVPHPPLPPQYTGHPQPLQPQLGPQYMGQSQPQYAGLVQQQPQLLLAPQYPGLVQQGQPAAGSQFATHMQQQINAQFAGQQQPPFTAQGSTANMWPSQAGLSTSGMLFPSSRDQLFPTSRDAMHPSTLVSAGQSPPPASIFNQRPSSGTAAGAIGGGRTSMPMTGGPGPPARDAAGNQSSGNASSQSAGGGAQQAKPEPFADLSPFTAAQANAATTSTLHHSSSSTHLAIPGPSMGMSHRLSINNLQLVVPSTYQNPTSADGVLAPQSEDGSAATQGNTGENSPTKAGNKPAGQDKPAAAQGSSINAWLQWGADGVIAAARPGLYAPSVNTPTFSTVVPYVGQPQAYLVNGAQGIYIQQGPGGQYAQLVPQAQANWVPGMPLPSFAGQQGPGAPGIQPAGGQLARNGAGNTLAEQINADIQVQIGGAFSQIEIDPNELDYGPGRGQRLGSGSYGEVFKGTWRKTEVAIKRFVEQNLSPSILRDFKAEVSIMSRLRHPNVVQFLGAVVQPPQLAIVTEFMPRGSLFRVLHNRGVQGRTIDVEPRRRLLMAMDIAKGLNYLHSCKPMIVHRDLKSPNLLVDRDWTVKVCDFGLSQIKNAAFLTSKSQTGTPGWMAPEVLRNEKCDEKSDVFSFGVILWELVTGDEPWGRMAPVQVISAVGLKRQRLEVPDDIQADVKALIADCWMELPAERPCFDEVLSRLENLTAITPSLSCAARRAQE